MALGEPHKKIEHRLTADENAMRPLTAVMPGARLDWSAHPTDFKWSEAEHPRAADGRFGEGGAGKPSEKVFSQKKAEDKFMLGHCLSFAIALQSYAGGEIRVLTRNGKASHAYVKIGERNVDVKGSRSTVQMALDIYGSFDGVTSAIYMPSIHNNLTKVNDKAIQQSRAYILANSRKFKA